MFTKEASEVVDAPEVEQFPPSGTPLRERRPEVGAAGVRSSNSFKRFSEICGPALAREVHLSCSAGVSRF